MAAESHSPKQYVKIWAILLGLFVISVLGPLLEHKILTLITAFGIAIVKAGLVATYFMHLNIEKRYIWYLLYSMLLAVALFFVAVSADVMKPDGSNWTNQAAHHVMEVKAKDIATSHEGGEHH